MNPEFVMKMMILSGSLSLALAAIFLGACQEPVANRTGDPSVFQFGSTSAGDFDQHRRRCCQRAARGSNH
jgi:hypothetical protein